MLIKFNGHAHKNLMRGQAHEIPPGRLGAMASWSPGRTGFRQAGASGAPMARVFPGAGRSPGLNGALRPCRLGRKKGATLVPWLILRFNRPVIRAEEDTGSRSAGRHACGSMGLVSPDAESGVRVDWREGASLFWRPLLQETPAAVRPRGSGASAAAFRRRRGDAARSTRRPGLARPAW